MRTLKENEIKKRGCEYCADMKGENKQTYAGIGKLYCMHIKCPYRELDNYKKYQEYEKDISNM